MSTVVYHQQNSAHGLSLTTWQTSANKVLQKLHFHLQSLIFCLVKQPLTDIEMCNLCPDRKISNVCRLFFHVQCVEKPVSTLRKDDQVGLHGLLLNLPGLGEKTDVACQMHRFSGRGPPWSPHLSSHRAGQHGEDDHHLGRRFRCFAYALQSIPLSLAFPLSL